MAAYLDHAATTPMRPEAVAAMLPFLGDRFGNPSGSHAVSRRAKEAIEDAREVVAGALGCRPGEVVFTAGGTEADNLAIAGVVGRRGGRPLCSAAEHAAVLHTTEALGGTVVGVTAGGGLDLDELAGALDPGVSVVSAMLVNNETGVVQPLDEVADVVAARAPRAALHTDAVQAFAWLDVASLARRADLVAVSGHKFGGPQGVGALVVRQGTALAPLLRGGGQEHERRSGTHNVAGIVALAAAMEATAAERSASTARVARLRDRLADGLLATVPDTVETGRRSDKAAGHAHLRFAGIESESLLFLLDEAGVYASAGSACASGAVEPSHVLLAMGLTKEEAAGAVRFSLGAASVEADVDLALRAVPEAVARLRRA